MSIKNHSLISKYSNLFALISIFIGLDLLSLKPTSRYIDLSRCILAPVLLIGGSILFWNDLNKKQSKDCKLCRNPMMVFCKQCQESFCRDHGIAHQSDTKFYEHSLVKATNHSIPYTIPTSEKVNGGSSISAASTKSTDLDSGDLLKDALPGRIPINQVHKTQPNNLATDQCNTKPKKINIELKKRCGIHRNRYVNRYCADCGFSICLDCSIHAHQSHSIRDLKSTLQNTVTDYKTTIVPRIEKCLFELMTKQNALVTTQIDLDHQYSKQQRSITRDYERNKQLLEYKTEKKKQTLMLTHGENSHQIQTLINEIDRKIKDAGEFLSAYYKFNFDNVDDLYLLAERQVLLQQLIKRIDDNVVDESVYEEKRWKDSVGFQYEFGIFGFVFRVGLGTPESFNS